MKLRHSLSIFGLVAMLGLGVGVGLASGQKPVAEAKAVDTHSGTFYYAVQSSVVGSKNVKLNVNTGNGWRACAMQKAGFTYTYSVNDTEYDIYTCVFTEATEKTYTLQFQLLNGETWDSQQEPVSSETNTSTLEDHLYIHSVGWKDKFTVTKYEVWDSIAYDLNDPDIIFDEQKYFAPKPTYSAGNELVGWYKEVGLSTPFENQIISGDISIYGEYTYHGNWEGTVNIDLKSCNDWRSAAANYAVYLWDETTFSGKAEGWSNYVTGTVVGTSLVKVDYSVGFNPTKMIVMRYNSTLDSATWSADKWANDNWGQTFDSAYTDFIAITTYDSTYNKYSYEFDTYVKIDGQVWDDEKGAYGDWGTIADLKDVRLNDAHHACYYGEVTLEAKTDFGVKQGSGFYKTYTAHNDLTVDFEGGGGSNIFCKTAGTYLMMFDSYTNSLYITQQLLEDADNWSQTFLDGVVCDGDGNITSQNWSTLAGTWAGLDNSIKSFITNKSSDASGSITEQALYRYDYIVFYKKPLLPATYSAYNDFMSRNTSEGKTKFVAQTQPITADNQSNNTLIIVIAASSIAVLALIGGYFYFRKRKEDR